MQILVHANHSINSGERLHEWISAEVQERLEHFASKLTRLEVHLTDLNQGKGGVDKRCSIEARLEGLKPMAASSDGATIAEALNGATDKLNRILDRKIGKLAHRKGHTPMGGDPFAIVENNRLGDDPQEE